MTGERLSGEVEQGAMFFGEHGQAEAGSFVFESTKFVIGAS